MSRDELIDLITIAITRWHVKRASGENADITAIVADVLMDNGYHKPSNIAVEVIDEVIELMEDIKDGYLFDEDIRAACGVRYAMIKIAELKKEYAEDTE